MHKSGDYMNNNSVLPYLILFVFIFVAGCAKKDAGVSEFGTTDLQKLEIREKVKSMRIVSFNAKDNFGKAIKDGFSGDVYYQFNDNGFISEETHYYEDGQMDTHLVYKRDDQMRILEINENATQRYSTPRTVFKYDDGGKNIEKTAYEADNSIAWKIMYSYDAGGNLAEEGTYDGDGSLISKNVYTYDSDNNLTDLKKYGGSFELLSATSYKYFEPKKASKSSDVGMIREAVEYDSKEVLQSTKSYQYNELGLVIGETTVSPGNETTKLTYKYEYNADKDWIKKITYYNTVPTLIEERQFNVDNNRPASVTTDEAKAGNDSKLQTDVFNTVYAWNDAHNTKDLAKFGTVYAEQVSLYGTTMTKDKAVALKKQLLTGKNEGYSQSVSDLRMKTLTDGLVQVDFVKSTQFQNTNKTYNAYLELSKSLGAWKITKESDQTTDKNLRR